MRKKYVISVKELNYTHVYTGRIEIKLHQLIFNKYNTKSDFLLLPSIRRL